MVSSSVVFLLLFASLLFYAWGEFSCVGVLLASIAMNYAFGPWVDGARGGRGERRARAIALAGLRRVALRGAFSSRARQWAI